MLGIWVKRSLRYYGARHLLFAATAALTSAVLCGALLTGESLRQGLQRDLRARLGPVRSAVYLREGVFPVGLAQRLPDAQAALLLKGELLTSDGAPCADDAQILGVASSNDASVVALNARARTLLSSAEGAVRFEKPALFAAELPLGPSKEARLVRRAVRVGSPPAAAKLLTPDFALRAGSVLPANALMAHAPLAEAAGVPGMANLLVSSMPPEEFERALADALTPEDEGLVLEPERRASSVERPETLVKSRRVFLPPSVLAALAAGGCAPAPATFHLADAFEAGEKSTPYGFVAAVTPDGEAVPRDLTDDETVINAWLAEALGVKAGDELTLRWRRFEAGGRLIADGRTFRVREVVAVERTAALKRAMPAFPGLAGVDSCAAWDVGMPMDEAKLKDAANEAYWKQWRETPKAVITFAAGKACFGTLFGEAMSVRAAAGEPAVRKALKGLKPEQAGFAVRPVWREGVAAAQGSTDFRTLFAGLAFVLVAAALLLSGLSLSMALEMRKGEVALFAALGWSRGATVRHLTAEWCVPLLAGALAGGGLGAALARTLVWSLGRFWRGAFAGAEMAFHFSGATAAAAAAMSAGLSLAVLVATVMRFARCRPVELWQGAGREGSGFGVQGSGKGTVWKSAVGGVFAVGALGLMAWSPSDAAANGIFFGAGFLLMVSLLLFAGTAGSLWACGAAESPFAAGVRRAVSSPKRSAPVVILLAVGVFLTLGILSMKHDPAEGWRRTSSGSGGFASIVTSVAPMDRAKGLELAHRVSGAKGAVPVRVREGDEAGCLNMSQPQTPRLLGLDAWAMARARAFEPEDSGGIWTAIERPLSDGAIPALAADQTMLQYSLKAHAGAADGAVFRYAGEGGAVWRVRVVGALPVRSGILQGALIVDERMFVRMFPSEGYRMWLCGGAPAEQKAEVGGTISDLRSPSSSARHPEPGVTVESTEARLRLLGSVESAYLDMFLVLGGLGVVLGAAGVALVILRGVVERRGELALLGALGLPRRTAVRMLTAEYGALVLSGLAAGTVPALIAVQPAARALGGQLPWAAVAGIVAGLAACAAASVLGAAVAASRRYGPEVLKEEV